MLVENNCQTEQVPPNLIESIEKLEFKGLRVRTMCWIGKAMLLCGTEKGELVLIDANTSTMLYLSLTHRGYVAQVAMDA